MKIISALLAIVSLHLNVTAQSEDVGGSHQLPLVLTPLIKSHNIKEAKAAAEVKFEEFYEIKSYAGYFTVSERFNSNTFFWFFPCECDYETAPVLLWLQGGPGESSLIGLFGENGPFEVNSSYQLGLREHRWTKKFSIIYVDNPVGCGFSFTNDGGHARNQTIIGEQLYEAISQFFDLFPELATNDFYVSGQSYAGKYVPALAYTILKKGNTSTIRLKGLAIGSAYSDPINQFVYSDYLFQIGLIDSKSKRQMREMEEKAIELISKKEWVAAGDNVTGFTEPINYLKLNDKSLNDYIAYIQRADVRRAIHVGNATFHDAVTVDKHLAEDFIQSVSPWISELLSNYRMMFYNGQVDIIVPYPSVTNFLEKLNFSSVDEYKNNDRHFWYVNGDLAGYVKQAGNLTEVLVRKAGHMIPRDQPEWALDLMTKFVYNQFQ
ncbi:venom serine carboxypeptidase-like isoform X1 [Photinus pyralis]|uniref:venom serine carboxypeptidase-like isoform X1 n=1 Tax=Photinus pyralis TaxID=7054 RepID=UPI001266EAC6|nr:venom serine carboxypeptidase-like isoform X1 [Photinus pyralis]